MLLAYHTPSFCNYTLATSNFCNFTLVKLQVLKTDITKIDLLPLPVRTKFEIKDGLGAPDHFYEVNQETWDGQKIIKDIKLHSKIF